MLYEQDAKQVVGSGGGGGGGGGGDGGGYKYAGMGMLLCAFKCGRSCLHSPQPDSSAPVAATAKTGAL